MKQLNRIAGLGATILLVGTTVAQPKYGATPDDSVKCVRNLSLYQEAFKLDAYADAYGPWREVVATCPASSKKMYVDGATILKSLLSEEKDEARKKALTDSLFMTHDLRIANFGEKAYVLGRKGQDMLSYGADDCKAAHEVLKESVELGGEKSSDITLSSYYQALNCMYAKGEATKDQMLSEYVIVIGHIEANLAKDLKETDRGYWITARDAVNSLFFSVAECADIGRIVKDMVAAKPADIELKTRLLKVLNGKDCTDEAIYRPMAEEVHRANPSAESAYSLGMMLARSGDMSGSLKYMKEAAELCPNCPDRTKYLLKAGQVASAAGNNSQSRSFANQVLQAEPKNGEALILIGNAIAATVAGCEAPDNWGAYWLAYDYYQRAKSLDPSVADKANDRMASAAGRFPTQAEAFFHQLTDGKSVQVACGGSNETTTVRTRKP